jgi:hypothetical protein
MPHRKPNQPTRYKLRRSADGEWAVISDCDVALASCRTLDDAMERTKALLAVHPLYELDRIWGVSPNEFVIFCRLRPVTKAVERQMSKSLLSL